MHTQISNVCFCSRFERIATKYSPQRLGIYLFRIFLSSIVWNNEKNPKIMMLVKYYVQCDSIVQYNFWFCRKSIVSIQTKCSAQMENDRRWTTILPTCRRRELEKYFSVTWPAKTVHHMMRCCVYKLPNVMHDAVPTPNCSRAFQRPWNNWNTSWQRKENDSRFLTVRLFMHAKDNV